MHFVSIILPALVAAAKAASPPENGVELTYRTATITQCFTYDGLKPSIDIGGSIGGATCVVNKPAATGDPITVQVQAPNCESCGCKTCAQTVVYTTKYDAFCSTGLYEQEYVITETYSGLASKPTMPSPSLPFGFACDVQTCNSCGPEPITATITYPVTDRPYLNAIPYPTQAPLAAKPKEKSQEGDDYAKGVKGSEFEHGLESPEVPSLIYDDESSKPTDVSKPGYSPKADSHGETDSDNSDADSDTDTNADTNADSDTDSDTNSHANSHADTGSNSSPAPEYGQKPEADAGADAEAIPGVKPASGDDLGFKSSVKPSWVPGPLETSSTQPEERPVYVSSSAGRGLGMAGVGIVTFAFLFSFL
ncbi:hypothetical protein FSARC_14345 [Fusarium sarcochroum]|uniref:Uncharacterized protein n=1 Tax=Fusarium sarcochroum TaxID=1208366 RepID=A0A8H4SU91_9HYPO|nr:hypothetical protein FSARC_14345 [Fusarium sarcochroum]